MNILESIVAARRTDVEAAREIVPLRTLKRLAARRVHHCLRTALRQPARHGIIAEVKQASPAAGLLRREYRPGDLARTFEQAGACAISVLTEPHRFLGDPEHLRDVRAAVAIPVLRKDFMVDEYQIYEAAAWGADAVLLIVAILEPARLRALHAEARACRLDVLVEAHTAAEVDAALELADAVVGVNSRDLKTLDTNLDVAVELAARIPRGRLAVAESGIRTRADVRRLAGQGYRGFLIGEALMTAADPAAALRELL